MTAFHAKHGISPTMFLMPSDHLLGRTHHEFANNNMSVMPIKKAISLYLASQPKEPQQITLGGGVSVKIGNSEAPPVRKVVHYYFGLRVLANAKAIAGTHQVASKISPGTRVAFAPLGVNVDYADHWLRRASQWDLSESVVLEWAQVICKKYNDPRTYTARERDCPERRRHVCDVRRPNGEACGSMTHGRLGNCPFISQQDRLGHPAPVPREEDLHHEGGSVGGVAGKTLSNFAPADLFFHFPDVQQQDAVHRSVTLSSHASLHPLHCELQQSTMMQASDLCLYLVPVV